MKQIRNPYTTIDGYNCFGCAPDNKNGLRMQFFEEGDAVVSLWQPEGHFQGYGNILHGGIHASLLDEAAAWAIFVKLGTSGVTSSLNIRYKRPAFIDRGNLRIEARLASQDRHLATIATRLIDGEGNLCSEADVVYFTYPEKMARKKLFYPGKEAFV